MFSSRRRCLIRSTSREWSGARTGSAGRSTINNDGTSNANAGACFMIKPLDQVDESRGEFVHAVITGCGDSNDGRDKMSFDAPSAKGQVAAIKAALADAKVSSAADTSGVDFE